MLIDDMLATCGDFGLTQWFLLALFSAANVLSSFHYFAQTFISITPNHTCSKYYRPYENMFYFYHIDNTSYKLDSRNSTVIDFINDWNFVSLTKELNWVCGDAWKSALMQSLYFIGSVTGTLVLGILSDKVGRRPMLVVANILAIVGNLLTIYLPSSLASLASARFVAGLATDTNFFMMYIIVMEYIRPSMRTFGLNVTIGIWYCFGCMLIPWVAIYTMEWRKFLLSITVPMVLIPCLAPFLPESAQWLISRGKIDEAITCFKQVAKMNKKQISDEVVEQFRVMATTASSKTMKSVSLLGLFYTPRLRKKTCILIFKTMVLTLCYDAMSRNIEGFGYDPFIMFTITSATILPSCIVILLLQDVFGRKLIAVAALFLTGVLNLCHGSVLTWTDAPPITIPLLGLLGRFCVNIAYNSGTQYAAELIPTQVRGQGLACIHVVGYAATFFSPHILYLATAWRPLPELVLGTLSCTGAVFCLFLPETLNQSLPVTLEDGEAFGEDEKFWEFITNLRFKKQIQSSNEEKTNDSSIS